MRPDLERLLEASYRTVVGRDLRTDAGGHPYDAPAALLRDGNEADPVFCYANHRAASVGGLTWDEFIRLPSQLWQNCWFGPSATDCCRACVAMASASALSENGKKTC
ncbi:MAG: MEKHLA domain-containing protein [Terrimicrobiaceae bacterium]